MVAAVCIFVSFCLFLLVFVVVGWLVGWGARVRCEGERLLSQQDKRANHKQGEEAEGGLVCTIE